MSVKSYGPDECADARRSKYTTFTKDRAETKYPGITINHCGNHSKNLRSTVQESLRKLRTNYIDLLYVHWWEHSTSIPEMMQSLNDLVRRGIVLYLGISDTPGEWTLLKAAGPAKSPSAWIVSQANEYARSHGMAQFVV